VQLLTSAEALLFGTAATLQKSAQKTFEAMIKRNPAHVD
jgi:hypothetical protein